MVVHKKWVTFYLCKFIAITGPNHGFAEDEVNCVSIPEAVLHHKTM